MSIYATLWTLKLPKEGDAHMGYDVTKDLLRGGESVGAGRFRRG